ncbi:uncharacterized protein LOC108632684 [Ceratina calcarata]|uniref:Uncharacterized protein LOC108632684 n=1 Tax=Ceratina calcarata TaxID=156304 RepID=A0AAJ7JGV5_9HYME|nr:uncharacterized protein LOC108632684 [Ceratina calcarata]
MAEIKEKMMTFKQYQAELQRKQLQKALTRNNVVGDGNRNTVKSCRSPSISSIPFDSSYCTSPLQTGSGIDKEIVSSSNNLRNSYLKMQHINSNQKKIVASSVKGSSRESDDEMDRLAMPPPKFYPYLSHNSRKSCGRSSRENLSKQDEYISSDIGHESSEKKYIYKHPNYGERCPDTSTPSRINTDGSPRNRKAPTFQKWTVALNERRELIVKGMLESGRLARSKPILKRLGNSKLESVSGHLYHLQGDLDDEDDELPEYVRGKFYNGFPDDWENVYEIWRTYVKKGSSVTFRWPTPITDSDDDINSEVTDIVFPNLKSSEKEVRDFDSFGESPEAPFNSESIHKPLRTKDKRDDSSHERLKMNSSTQTSISGITAHLTHTDMRLPLNNFIHDDKENIHADASRASVAATKLMNIVNVIVSNLTDNNQSIECINKFATMLEIFSSLLLNGSIKEGDTSKGDSKSIDEPNSLNVTYNFAERLHSKSSPPSRNTTNKETAICNNLSQRKRPFSKAIGDDNDSDNEVYSGVTKIQLSQVIRQKETVLKPSKRKLRKQEVSRSPNECTATSNHTAHSFAEKVTEDNKKRRNAESDDSSRESERLRVKNYTSPNTRSVTERRQAGTKELTKDKNACDTKGDSVHENSFKPIPQTSRIGKATEDNKKRRNAESDDSSVSIMYEESERLRVKNYTSPKTRSVTERRQAGTKELTKDRNACDTKGDSVHENSFKPIPQTSRIGKATEDNKKRRNAESDDSSVSIMYEESERLRVKNYTSPKTRSVTERRQAGTKELTKDRNACDTKGDSVHENSFEPIPQTSRIGKVTEDNKKRRNAESDESSISIMYEESDRLMVKDCTSSNTRSVVERRQPGKKKLAKDRNACETKGDSLHERSFEPTPQTSRSTRPVYDSSVKRVNNDEMVEKNLSKYNEDRDTVHDHQNDSFLEKSGKSINSPRLQHILKKMTAKPMVISSVPVDIKTVSAQINCLSKNGKENLFEDAERKTGIVKIESAESEYKNLIRRKSPLKCDNRKKSTNFFFDDMYNNDDDDNRHTESIEVPETNNIDSIVSNKSLQENDIIASKDNNDNCKPKLLSTWTPIVITCGTDLCLIFEGNLINDAGHVITRKFKTDTVLRRVSARLVETANHEFYQLIGSPSAKHVVPKKLLDRCRHGCPARIEQFCEAWESLQAENKNKQNEIKKSKSDSSKNTVSVSVSSKGRRIISPLNYWTGERVTLKGEDMIYVCSDSKDNSQNPIRNNYTPKRKKDNSTDTQRDSSGNVDDKKTRRGESKAEGNIQIINRIEQTAANHSSPQVGKHGKILYSYQRGPVIPREDDTSCDE